MDALQESSANVESWKKQLGACKAESDTLREKVTQLFKVKHKVPTLVFPETVLEKLSLSVYITHKFFSKRTEV